MGDTAITVEFGEQISPEINKRVQKLAKAIREKPLAGIIETVPTFRSLTVQYDPAAITQKKLCKKLTGYITQEQKQESEDARIFGIPVCYGGQFGEDLCIVAKHAGLSEKEVIKIHSGPEYLIYMLGFLPGFAYLGGLDSRIETPRLQTPRKAIPAGAVGIGGRQTGIYPVASPGGWNLIGKTPLRFYDPDRAEPILLRAGDFIRFLPVSQKEFETIENDIQHGTFTLDIQRQKGGGQ